MIKAELSEVQRTEAIDQSSGALHLKFNFCHFSTDVAPLCGFLTQIFMRLPWWGIIHTYFNRRWSLGVFCRFTNQD